MCEYVNSTVLDNGRLTTFIVRADAVIRNSLRDYYTVDTDLLTTPWNEPPFLPFPQADQSISANSSTGALSDITVASTAITELWTITFTSTTAFSVTGSISGSQGTGSTSSLFTSTNSFISIPVANWSGVWANTDKVYVSTYKSHPMIVLLSTLIAASMALTSIFQGTQSAELSVARDYMAQAKAYIKALQMPYEAGGMSLDTLSARDTSPEGVNYNIDILGNDQSLYMDNTNTNYDDSQS